MGCAAININGSTIHAFFDIPVASKKESSDIDILSTEKLREFRMRLGIESSFKMFIIILDEISMVTPQMIASIDSRLRQATNIQQIFGGVPVMMFGDFAQLPPVGGLCITHAIMKKTQQDITEIRTKQNKKLSKKNKLPVLQENQQNNQSSRLKFGNNNLYARGIEIFTKAKWIPLIEQVRARNDKNHTEMVRRLGSGEK